MFQSNKPRGQGWRLPSLAPCLHGAQGASQGGPLSLLGPDSSSQQRPPHYSRHAPMTSPPISRLGLGALNQWLLRHISLASTRCQPNSWACWSRASLSRPYIPAWETETTVTSVS